MTVISKFHRILNRFVLCPNGSNARRAMSSSAPSVLAGNSIDMALSNADLKQLALMDEMCIVVNEEDKVIGSKTKKECHLMDNINKGVSLHRAFSSLIFNTNDELLLTQRSSAKITFPNYWVNTCCSHPLYNQLEMDETDAIGVRRAAQRRLHIELGIDPLQIPIEDIKYITRFLYKAPSDGLWGEHELDYALIIRKNVLLNPDPNEVKAYHYVTKQNILSFLKNEESKGNLTAPWFKVIVENFIFKWWDHLNEINKYHDRDKIHNFI